MKPTRLRSRAHADFAEVIDYYSRNAAHVADAFVGEVDATLARIRRHPKAGSLRFEQAASTPGLRSRALRRFPFVIFYLEGPDEIVIVRILHAQSDLSSQLNDE